MLQEPQEIFWEGGGRESAQEDQERQERQER